MTKSYSSWIFALSMPLIGMAKEAGMLDRAQSAVTRVEADPIIMGNKRDCRSWREGAVEAKGDCQIVVWTG